MDNVSKENVQELDPEVAQAMEWNDEASEATPEDIFGNPVILNNILEQLPNSKLLELSLVSKLWKKEARIVMKKRGNVMALLETNSFRECGQVFKVFGANLETLNETLCSGMTISLNKMDDCQEAGAQEVERIHESILAGMRGKLKRISIRNDEPEVCWNNAQDCPSFLLLRHLLKDSIGDLEHLTLKIEEIMEPFIQQFFPPGPYPSLKVLKLDDGFVSNEENFRNQIRMLVSRAPNLQEIHTNGHVSLRETMREGIVHVDEYHVHNPMEDISENVIPALRLKLISFIYNTEPQLELSRFNEKAQSLLRTCCTTTLELLDVEEVSLVLLMSYGIRLKNVEYLEIRLDYAELEQLEPRIISILSRFDFTYVFPNLNQVCILKPMCRRSLGHIPRDTMDAIVEQANAVEKEPLLPRARSIKCLELLYSYSIPTSAVQFLAHIFPDIEEIHVNGFGEVIPIGSTWELWPELKLIVVSGERYQRP